MKELQNIIHRHFEDPKQKKRYLAMFIALSMLVSFMVPLILMEPADSKTGVLACGKIEHIHGEECYIGDMLNCSIQEHIHTEECYKNLSIMSLRNGTENDAEAHSDNEAIPNAGTGKKGEDGKYGSVDANTVDGVTYSPATQKLYTLLFGEPKENKTHWVDENKSLDANLEIANEEFFLGFASDFCAFIENDFEAFDADAEGRVFIGGDLIFNGNPEVGEWNYQVGAGDFGQFIPLTETDEYENTHNFASGIIGGKVFRLGTLTTGSTYSIADGFEFELEEGRTPRHISGTDVYYYPDEGAYKSFIIGNIDGSRHLDEDVTDPEYKDIAYSTDCNHKYYDHDCQYCRDISDMDTDKSDHAYLRNVNELAQFYQYDNVKELLDKTFNTVRTRSSSLATMQATSVQNNDGTLVLDASDIGDAKTAYFKLDDWTNNGNNISKVIIIVPDDRMTVGESIYTDDDTVTDLDLNIIVSCDDEEINISNVTTFVKSYARGGDNGYKISNNNSNATNNHPVSSNILYNFHNAIKVNILEDTNFNGTILAPNADVKTPEKCPGHLSGALIAKSFYGGLEFGYRPYRGGVDVLGDAVGYEVPVDKFYDSNYVSSGKFLPGAMFAVKDEFGNVVSLFDSTDQTKYVDLPSKIDLSGNTIYKPVVVTTATATSTCTTTTVVSKTIVTTTVAIDVVKISDGDTEIPIPTDKNVPIEVEIGKEIIIQANEKANWKVVNNNNQEWSGYQLTNLEDGLKLKFKITDPSVSPFTFTLTDKNNNQDITTLIISAKECNLNVENIIEDKTEFEVSDTVILSTSYAINGAQFKVKYKGSDNQEKNENINFTDGAYKFELTQKTAYQFEVYYDNHLLDTYTVDINDIRVEFKPTQPIVNEEVIFTITHMPENTSKVVYSWWGKNFEYESPFEFKYKFDSQNEYPIDVQAYDADGNVIAKNQIKVAVKNADSTNTNNDTSDNANDNTSDNTNDNSNNNASNESNNDNIDEPANENTSLIITPETDKDLLSLRFVFPDRDDNKNRSINAIITYSDDSTQKVENCVRADAEISGKHYIDINCPQKEGYKITKVEIVPVSADTPIDYCVLSYSAPCIEVSRKVPVNQTAQNDIMHILKSFDTNEPNYVSDVYFTVANSEEITDRDGKVECYVYTDGTEDAWHGEAEFNFTDKANVKFENINVSGVTKIVIKPKECEALPISEYTINTLESEAPDTTPKTEHVEEHKYTIEEIQPVEGFFPTDAIYEVTVKETINYESDTVDGKPKAAHAEITAVKKVENEDDVTTFSYSLDISFTDTTKTITIGDTVFEMTLDEDRKVTSISFAGREITEVSKPMIIGKNDYNYYFNPETKMIVPIPGNHITFTNTPGLLFKKFDDGKNPVSDVTIKLFEHDATGEGEDVLLDGKHTHLYNIKAFVDGKIYYFKETKTNGKYEKPADIYFKVVEKQNADNLYEVIYGTKEQIVDGNGEGAKVLDIINNRVIEMENIRIGGVKLKIQKLHYGTNVDVNTTINDQTVQNGFNESIPLSGAKFDLFAENGTFIGETTTVTDKNGLTEFTLTDESPDAYVSKSSSGSYYLKPGVYYLAEKEIPEHSNSNNSDEYANPGRIYFTVDTEENNFAVHSGVKGIRSIGFESTGNVGDVTINGKKLDDQSGAEIVGVTKFKFEIVNPSKIQIYSSAVDGHILDANKMIKVVENGQEKDINEIEDFCGQPEIEKDSNGNELKIYTYSATYNPSIDFTKLQIQNYGSSLNIRYIELEDEDGIKYIYSPGSNTDVNNVFGLTNEMLNSKINKGEIVDGKNDESIANLVIGNKTQPDVTEVSVNKKWAGDEKFEYLREDVKVKLYYSNTKLNYSDIEAANWENVVSPVTPDMFVTTDTDIGDTETNEGESDTPATASEEQKPVEVTLNAANKWKYTWTDLPAKVRGENGAIETSYYYYVREIEGSDRYTPSYSQASDGTHIVTNTLKTVDIPVTKEWNDNDIQNITVPPSLYVHLEWRELDGNGNGTGEFKPVPGKTLVLTDPWSGEFEGLPVGFEYRFSEPYVQNGWTPTHDELNTGWSAENSITEGIKTVVGYNTTTVTDAKLKNTAETGGLTIEKAWSGDETDTSSRPEQLKFKVWRTISKPYFDETDAPYDDEHYTDYERLLQHSLYFYDANMCGTDVSENSALAWRSNCHTEDEVPGGYHDAGDHVMFGLPQGYTASMLGWTYFEFFKDNDGVKSVNAAEKEHIKVILKRFYDFFVNSVHYDENGEISEILVQKGDGDIDHVIWCAPENQAYRTNEMVWSDKGSDIAAEYAAALAIGYLNFKDDVENFPDTGKYLEVAKKLYDFSTKSSIYGNSFYPSGSDADDKAWAAAWLYEATENDSTVTEEKRSEYEKARTSEAGELQWDNLQLAAAMVYARQENDWSKVTKYIDNTYITDPYYNIHSWGTARFNAIAQTATLIAAKYNPGKKADYLNWVTGQMSQLLGKNNWKDTIDGSCADGVILNTNLPVCLITNFSTDDSVYSPQAPHHRAASGWDDHVSEYRAYCTHNPTEKHQLIGALVGGPAFGSHDDGKQVQMYDYVHNHPLEEHTYIDDLHDYCCNEVSIDYNAGLVGAAAGLYYFTGTGERSTKIEGVEIDKYGLSGKDEYNAFTTYETKVKQLRMAFNTLSVMSAAPEQTSTGLNTYELDVEFGEKYDIALTGVSSFTIEATSTGVVNFGAVLETDKGKHIDNENIEWGQNTTKTLTKTLEAPIDINWIKLTNSWNGSGSDLSLKIIITYSGPPPKVSPISGPKSLYEGETKPYTCENATDWSVTPEGFAQISQNGELTANKNVEGDTTVTIKAIVDGEEEPFDVTIKPVTIGGNTSIGTEKSGTIKINETVTGNYTWNIISDEKSAIDSFESKNNECSFTSSANAGDVVFGLYTGDELLAQVTVIVSEGSFSLSAGKTTLKIGEQTNLQPVKWDSTIYEAVEGSEFVWINGSDICGVAIGTAKIVAKTKNGDESQGSETSFPLYIEVTASDVKIKDIDSKNVGDELQLDNLLENKPDSEVVWDITDGKENAIIVNNKIIALKPGSVTIKAIVKYKRNNDLWVVNNNQVTEERTATFTINSPSLQNLPQSIVVDSNLELNNDYIQNLGETAIVEWSINNNVNNNAAKCENNKVTALNVGSFGLTALIYADGYKDTHAITLQTDKNIDVSRKPMSLSLTSASVEIKDQIVITANNVPDGYDIVWTADNDKVEITPNGNSVTIVGKKDGASVITATPVLKTADANEPMTVSEDEPQAVSATVNVTNVPQYDEYYFIHKEVVNKSIPKDSLTDINVAELIGSNKVGKIVVKFNSNSASNYNGVIYYKGETTETSAEINYEFTATGSQIVTIDITPEVLTNLCIKSNWNEANSLIESIYFYGKIDGPTIVNAPVSMTVGEEVILEALGFPEGGVSWSVDDDSTYASIIEDGTLTAEKGSATEEFVIVKISATSKTDKSIVKSVEVRIYPKPNELKVNGENEVTIKYTSSATLTNTAGFDFDDAIIKIGDAENDDVLTINNGEVSLTDTYKNLHESVSVTIQLPGDEEFAVSNLVTINFVGKVKLSGSAEVPLNYNSRIKIENAIGDVTWTFEGYDETNNVIKDGETVLYNVEVDKGVYTVIDPTNEANVILTLYPDGRFKSGNTKGIVDVIANVDGEASDPYQIKVSEIPIRPVIPQEGLDEEFEEFIITTGEGWEGSLENLPIYDEKGNIYYYYVEEYAYKNSASEDWTLLEAKDGYIYGKNNSKYIPMSYESNGLDLISLNNQNQNVTIGNKMTGKTQGQMPSSGGVGRTTYYFFGGMIMLLSAAGYTVLRRRQSSRRAE